MLEPGNPQALNRYAYVYHNPLRSIDGEGHLPVVPLLVAGAILALKVIDYGWTAYDAWQSLRVMKDPHASPEARAEAAANLALTAAFEAGEPDDLLPVSLPLDDLARVGLIGGVRKIGKEVEEEATKIVHEIASNVDKSPIVIGENMHRVRKYAEKIGAQTIEDFIPKGQWSLEANRQWIRRMMEEGRQIIDIGPDFERRFRRIERGEIPYSDVYNLERMELKGYGLYQKSFIRLGKWKGGVPGLDWD